MSNCEPAAFSLIMKTLGLEILDCSVVKEVESSCCVKKNKWSREGKQESDELGAHFCCGCGKLMLLSYSGVALCIVYNRFLEYLE